jgi:hypothetical protein
MLLETFGFWKEPCSGFDLKLQWQTMTFKLLEDKYTLLERARAGHYVRKDTRKGMGRSPSVKKYLYKSSFELSCDTYKDQVCAQSTVLQNHPSSMDDSPIGDSERMALRKWWRVLAKYAEKSLVRAGQHDAPILGGPDELYPVGTLSVSPNDCYVCTLHASDNRNRDKVEDTFR